jgi:dethiobiotin synthetase/adenosylmethionine--8-amino-7-oxononanoate aminotransferase
LFQHCLVDVVRSNPEIFGSATTTGADPKAWKGLPVVFDEVFTGLYRLGRFTSSSFLQAQPDISCHAKLLTGGLVPLCTTLASDSIYNSFLSSDKSDALLHGHSVSIGFFLSQNVSGAALHQIPLEAESSLLILLNSMVLKRTALTGSSMKYTAHAVGCHVANTSLNAMLEMDRNGKWDDYKVNWQEAKSVPTASEQNNGLIWSVWSKGFVRDISLKKDVESVIALGSVLAISLRDEHAGK